MAKAVCNDAEGTMSPVELGVPRRTRTWTDLTCWRGTARR